MSIFMEVSVIDFPSPALRVHSVHSQKWLGSQSMLYGQVLPGWLLWFCGCGTWLLFGLLGGNGDSCWGWDWDWGWGWG